MPSFLRKTWILPCSVLFLLALTIRLHNISDSIPHPDEPHWEKRGQGILENIQNRNFRELTTHLRHPGIPGAYSIALGIYFGQKLDVLQKRSLEENYKFDRLLAARIACAIIATFSIPLLYVAGSMFVSPRAGFLAAAFLTFDPHHIYLSRLAHIDAILTFFVTLSLFLYLWSVQTGSIRAKLLAGAAWGLCISTKPTAAALVIGFLAIRIFRYVTVPKKSPQGETSLLSWSDIWALLLGHTLLGVLYTRLWTNLTNEPYKLNTPSTLRSLVHQSGEWLGHFPLLSLLSIGILFSVGTYMTFIYRRSHSNNSRHLSSISFLLAFFGCALFFIPAIPENIIGYWSWTAELKQETHQAFGQTWGTLPWGYLGEFLCKMPSIGVIGVCFGLLAMAICWPNRADSEALICKRHTKNYENFFILGALLLVFFCWVIPLSFSGKQAYRYAAPVLPALYLFSAIGFQKSFWILPLKKNFSPVIAVGTAALFLLSAGAAYSAHPNYSLFFNSLTGGIQSSTSRGERLHTAGEKEALRALHEIAKKERSRVLVMTLGDQVGLNYGYQRQFKNNRKTSLRPVQFFPLHANNHGYYLLGFHSTLERTLPNNPRLLDGRKKIFSYLIDHVEILSIFSPSIPKEGSPLRYSIKHTHRQTGRLTSSEEVLKSKTGSEQVLFATPSSHKRGFLIFNQFARLSPGDYSAQFRVGLPFKESRKESFDSNRFVVRLGFGKQCQRIVTYGELERGELAAIDLSCHLAAITEASLEVYWFGNVPVVLSDIDLMKQQ